MDDIKKKQYEKPTILKLKKMTFPQDIIESETGAVVCKQCSS